MRRNFDPVPMTRELCIYGYKGFKEHFGLGGGARNWHLVMRICVLSIEEHMTEICPVLCLYILSVKRFDRFQ